MQSQTHRAVVASCRPYGEADLIVRLLTEHRGVVAAFARAARKSRKRFGASLQPLVIGAAELADVRGRELPQLLTFEAQSNAYDFAQDARGFGRACYVVELAERHVGEDDANPEIFALVCEGLQALSSGVETGPLLRAFELRLLEAAGFLPELIAAEDSAIDRDSGALVEEGPGAIPLSEEAIALAAALLSGPLTALPAAGEPILRQVARIFSAHLKRLGVKRLHSVDFMKSLAPE